MQEKDFKIDITPAGTQATTTVRVVDFETAYTMLFCHLGTTLEEFYSRAVLPMLQVPFTTHVGH